MPKAVTISRVLCQYGAQLTTTNNVLACLRTHDLIPTGGRGNRAAEINLLHGVFVLLGVSADRPDRAASQCHAVAELLSSAGKSLTTRLIEILDGEPADIDANVTICRRGTFAEIKHAGGQVERFEKSGTNPNSFSVSATFPAVALQSVALKFRHPTVAGLAGDANDPGPVIREARS